MALTDQSAGAAAAMQFTATHWSVVLTARDGTSVQAHTALAQLCRTYWYPLYAYVRRKGYSAHDSQDLTQGFFAHRLRRSFLDSLPALPRHTEFCASRFSRLPVLRLA